MATCAHCGDQILFGGVRVGRLRYCRRNCLEEAEAAEYRVGQARLSYQKCLARLREDPTNPHTREQALEAGRRYAAYKRHREGGRLTVYDETSIKNDIEAATAAAFESREPSGESPMSIEERLETLLALKVKNLITDEEYSEKRSAILSDL